MIHVTIYQNTQNEYRGFRTEGHAGFDDAGYDIVCAAASILVINTINAIDRFTDDDVQLSSDEGTGMISFFIKGKASDDTQLLFKTMVLGLEQMVDDENYAEYIDLTFEEV